MRLDEIRRALEQAGELRGGLDTRNPEIVDLTSDSREVRPGSLFVAIPGTRVDGTEYVGQATRRGAVAVVAPRELPLPEGVAGLWVRDARRAVSAAAAAFHGRPSRDLRVVGITGTNGKTTTSYILGSIFDAAGLASGVIGTTGYFVGDRHVAAPVTTPDAIRVQGLLAEMRDEGITHVAMEISSHALDQHRTRDVELDVGVFTNLSGDHLDYHRDMAAYRDAKSSLFRQLAPSATAVLNRDDGASRYFLNVCRARPLAYSLGEGGGVTLRLTSMTLDGTTGEIRCPTGRIPLRTRLVGEHNLSNILAAAAAALALGLPRDAIEAGIEALEGVPGRLEPVDGEAGFHVLVDYAHTDDALRNVLRCLRPLVPGRLITVFGCGGDRDRTKRPRMGRVVERGTDVAVVTSDNPRSERPETIIDEILKGMEEPGEAIVSCDRRDAIYEAIRGAEEGDCVLIAGKGHETTQTIGGEALPFDDRLVAREVLEDVRRLRRAS